MKKRNSSHSPLRSIIGIAPDAGLVDKELSDAVAVLPQEVAAGGLLLSSWVTCVVIDRESLFPWIFSDITRDENVWCYVLSASGCFLAHG